MLIVGNWKMNPKNEKEALVIARQVVSAMKLVKATDVVLCPPFPFFSILKKVQSKKVTLGAQDMFYEKEGSYTGEISAEMLRSFGIKTVILGHSERRREGETNEIVGKKIMHALRSGITPILCIGEQNRDTTGFYLGFIKDQIHECLARVSKAQARGIIIAYEPLWAIGSSAVREATPEEFVEMRIFIRRVLADMYDTKIAQNIRILYGGSVHPENAKQFLSEGGADGLLVGRDSIIPKKFIDIIKTSRI